jgi:3-oxoacyl-[acyl-carrier-protein] synthase-1
MSKRIFVTGMGIITSIGTTTEENFVSLLSLKSGIGKLELFSSIHAGIIPVGEIKITDAALCKMAGVKENSGYTRTALIALIATKEALASAQISNLKEARTGLISSTTVGGMREFENILSDLTDLTKDGDFRHYAHVTDAGEHTERIADLFGFKDYISTTSTACSSASNAIILGAELIKHGQLDRVVCGGSDVLSKFTLNGFNSLMILDKRTMHPFDATRGGVNLGEGAAYVVIESEEMVQKFNKKPLAELTGYSNSNDAFHQTASSPDGDGALLSMTRALAMAGVKPAEVDYINCHGTATENNDLSEALAIQNLFKEHVPHFSSTKPYTGHTLAAAGSVEAVFAILCIQNKVLFPNLNFENQMPETSIAPVKSLLQNVEVKHVLSNSFGFGGSNTSLLFSKV